MTLRGTVGNKIDANLTPSNIKKDVTIFGVDGNLESLGNIKGVSVFDPMNGTFGVGNETMQFNPLVVGESDDYIIYVGFIANSATGYFSNGAYMASRIKKDGTATISGNRATYNYGPSNPATGFTTNYQNGDKIYINYNVIGVPYHSVYDIIANTRSLHVSGHYTLGTLLSNSKTIGGIIYTVAGMRGYGSGDQCGILYCNLT